MTETHKPFNDDPDYEYKKFQIGDEVVFYCYDSDKVSWGNNDNPMDKLDRGAKYIVKNIDIHSYHTKIMLEGIDGKFNSCHFKIVTSPEIQNKIITQDLEKWRKINSCSTFEQLKEAIISISTDGLIMGTHKTTLNHHMIYHCDSGDNFDVRNLNDFTRNYGIRQQALLIYHHNQKKHE